ncbi:MAG: hypothetical protein V2A79_08415 [Planctomycetota bacterium]
MFREWDVTKRWLLAVGCISLGLMTVGKALAALPALPRAVSEDIAAVETPSYDDGKAESADGRISESSDEYTGERLVGCVTPPAYDYTITPGPSWQTTPERSFAAGGCHVYRMYLQAARSYDFSLCVDDGVGGWTDTIGDGDVTMYDSAGAQRWYIDGVYDCDYFDATTLGTVYEGWSPPADGYYYLKVSEYFNATMSYVLAYRRACSGPDCNTNGVPDECEPQDDCQPNGVQDICDIANGTSQDCNNSGAPDECDVAAGTSEDCDDNGVPDECELGEHDCNTNGIPDDCDLAAGNGTDMNANGIPDDCEGDSCPPAWTPGFQSPEMNSTVYALTVFDDGTGPALYAGGLFTTAGGVPANYIAKWDGTQWSAVGGGMNNEVDALTVFDDGTGPALYAGGNFTTAGGVTANYIAKWNGVQWSALGSGMNSGVRALTVFDDGTGPALYAGGYFTTAGGVPANFIAKWNPGAPGQWSALGSGMGGTVPYVYALTVFDDGTGPALYAGGRFTTAGGVPANRIAKWNGTQWSALGSGMNNDVWALTVFDDGTGAALHAGGLFATAGGVPANGIAKWDGTQWSALGSGMGGGYYSYFCALTVLDDGTGPAL